MWETEEMMLSNTAYHSGNGSMVYTVKMMKRKKGTCKNKIPLLYVLYIGGGKYLKITAWILDLKRIYVKDIPVCLNWFFCDSFQQVCITREDVTKHQKHELYLNLSGGERYLVPGYNDRAAEDEGVAHGEVCGPYDQAQETPPSLWQHLCTHQHKHRQKHAQAAAHHAHKGTVFQCILFQQQETEIREK